MSWNILIKSLEMNHKFPGKSLPSPFGLSFLLEMKLEKAPIQKASPVSSFYFYYYLLSDYTIL